MDQAIADKCNRETPSTRSSARSFVRGGSPSWTMVSAG